MQYRLTIVISKLYPSKGHGLVSLKFTNEKPIRIRHFFSRVRDEHKYAKQSVKRRKKRKTTCQEITYRNVSKNKAWILRLLASLLHFIFFNAAMPCKNGEKIEEQEQIDTGQQQGLSWTNLNSKLFKSLSELTIVNCIGVTALSRRPKALTIVRYDVT